jgi:basic amino acid/polyamine antiporter, APA family
MDAAGRWLRAGMSENRGQYLGFWMCVALVVGNIVGAGIFMLPASLAPFGLNSLVAWSLVSAGSLALALVFAALARALPGAGGPYAYTHAAFGALPAFVVAWGYWVSIWVANAGIATGASSYLASLVPWLAATPGATTTLTLSFVWFFTIVSWWGLGAVGWIQLVTTVLKLLPLVAVAALGILHVGSADIARTSAVPLSLDGTTAASTLTLYALLGLESANIADGRVRDPARTIPRAALVGTLIAALLYTVACTVIVLIMPIDALKDSQAPFADAARLMWGPNAARLVAICAAISAIGCLNGWTLLQGEVPYVMARNGVFPSAFARVSARGTPTFALVVSSLLVTLLVLATAQRSLNAVFEFMSRLSTVACLVMYVLCSLAILRLGFAGRLAAHRTIARVAVIGVLASLFSAWTLIGAGRESVLWGAALLAAGLPFYWLARRATASGSAPAGP